MLEFYNNIKNALINSGINYPMHASDNRLNIKLNDHLMCKIYSKSVSSWYQTALAYMYKINR